MEDPCAHVVFEGRYQHSRFEDVHKPKDTAQEAKGSKQFAIQAAWLATLTAIRRAGCQWPKSQVVQAVLLSH